MAVRNRTSTLRGKNIHKKTQDRNKRFFQKNKKKVLKNEEQLFIGGRNSIKEALSENQVKELFVKKGNIDQRLKDIVELAENKSISIKFEEQEVLDEMVEGVCNQGVVALMKPFEFSNLEKVLFEAKEEPFVVLLDGVEDVRNIGAIARTAECAGASALLLPKHKSAPVTAAAIKTGAGAFSYLPVCQIGNIRQTLEKLKEKGFWVVGADMDGENLYYESNLKGPLVIVMGAEGKGISSLTKKMCDFCVRIPMKGKVSSLNVSVAAALLMYEAVKQRG